MLEEHEFHFVAEVNISNPPHTSKEKPYDAISSHFEAIVFADQTDERHRHLSYRGLRLTFSKALVPPTG